MKARISLLHNTEENWAKLNFIPKSGEVIIYDPDEHFNYARAKIGDGERSLKELDFFVESALTEVLNSYRYTELIDAGRVTDYNK